MTSPSSVRHGVDVFTFEIIRQRLYQVTEESIAALKNVSGSPITNEGHDMMVSIYTPTGGLSVGGVGFLHHLTSAAQAVKHIVSIFSDDPGINPGDVFMLNDSYVAALHAPDVYIISPLHFEGVVTGFVANFVHVTDIGAVDAGGFSPNARDVYQEGFVTEGLKIVDGGVRRKDVIDTILRNVRDPDMTALDLKSQIAANYVAAKRMHELYEDYGVQVVQGVLDGLIDESEELLRGRLKEIPDGKWRARQYVDMPDQLHKVELTLTKEGDRLEYDFTGTDEQSHLGINCSFWAGWGAIFAPIFPLLCWDIPWNEGLTRLVTMKAPRGSLVNCERPAPVSIATVGMIQVVNNLSVKVLSKMFGASEKYHKRSTAVWHGSHLSVMISGKSAEGDFFVTLLTDTFAGSGGARATSDGIDIGGEVPNVVSRWGNAETQEHHSPILYLYRGAVRDSGGPGRYRGGVSHEYMIMPHGSLDGTITVGLCAKGLEVPMSAGLFGGLPGCNIGQVLVKKVDLGEIPGAFEEVSGERLETVQWGEFTLGPEDGLCVRFMGGGGYGDPLERDPNAVAADVANGLVSQEVAFSVYGVALHRDGSVADDETATRRLHIRSERLGREVDSECSKRSSEVSGQRISEYLTVADDGVRCSWCGYLMCDPDSDWKDSAVTTDADPAKAGPNRTSKDGLVLRSYCCPNCATFLDTEIALEDDEPIHDRVAFRRG